MAGLEGTLCHRAHTDARMPRIVQQRRSAVDDAANRPSNLEMAQMMGLDQRVEWALAELEITQRRLLARVVLSGTAAPSASVSTAGPSIPSWAMVAPRPLATSACSMWIFVPSVAAMT